MGDGVIYREGNTAMYRLSWEMVSVVHLARFCSHDPTFYQYAQQIVPNSKIPDEYWRKVDRTTDDPWQQYRQLQRWEKADKEFVRNVKLEVAQNELIWLPVEDT